MNAWEVAAHRSRVAEVSLSGRWTPKRKVSLLVLVAARLVTAAEASSLYGVSAEELASWRTRHDRLGLPGLSSTKLQALGHG